MKSTNTQSARNQSKMPRKLFRKFKKSDLAIYRNAVLLPDGKGPYIYNAPSGIDCVLTGSDEISLELHDYDDQSCQERLYIKSVSDLDEAYEIFGRLCYAAKDSKDCKSVARKFKMMKVL